MSNGNDVQLEFGATLSITVDADNTDAAVAIIGLPQAACARFLETFVGFGGAPAGLKSVSIDGTEVVDYENGGTLFRDGLGGCANGNVTLIY